MGVLELASLTARPRDDVLLGWLEPVAVQIGQFVRRKQAEAELRDSRDQLQVILEGVGDGVTVQDRAGRLVYANSGAAKQLGYEHPDQLLAAPVTEVMSRFELFDSEGQPFPLERLPGRRALLGEGGGHELIRWRSVSTGEERWSFVTATPVSDDEGAVRFAINIFQDVTDQMRTRQTERFLGEASALLASSLDYETTLDRVAELAVSLLADWCIVFIKEEGRVRQLKIAHADPTKAPLVSGLQRRYPFDPNRSTAVAKVLQTGESVLMTDIQDDLLRQASVDDEHYQALRELGFRSAIAAPLRVGDRVLGAILFVSSGRPLAEEDLAVAQELGRRAALAMDNARLYEERTRAALILQRSLMPPEPPRIPGLDLAARYHPASGDVGGDFYDVFETPDGAWILVIGDVCGRGPEAAALTALARYTVRAAAIGRRRPTAVLELVNEALVRQDLDNRFCTMVYARLAPERDGCSVVLGAAGHPPPIVVRANGRAERVATSGSLLGILPDIGVSDTELRLGPGDTLLMFTDGLVERPPPDSPDLGTLLRSCAGQDADTIAAMVETTLIGDAETRDDVALVVVRVAP
jgi:PAS domain S-box-containing protein